MKRKKIRTILIACLLAAMLGVSGWLVLHPVQPWPSIDGPGRHGAETT